MTAEDSDISCADGAFKLLTFLDQVVRDIASNDLRTFVEYRTRFSPIKQSIADFLSGAYYGGSNRISSVWTRARAASTRLGITWSIDGDFRTPVIVNDTTISDRLKIFKSLRQVYRSEETVRLVAAHHQEKFSTVSPSRRFHLTIIEKVTSLCLPSRGSSTVRDLRTYPLTDTNMTGLTQRDYADSITSRLRPSLMCSTTVSSLCPL